MQPTSQPIDPKPGLIHLVAKVDLEMPAFEQQGPVRKIETFEDWVVPGSQEEREFRHHILTLADSSWCRVHSASIQIQ